MPHHTSILDLPGEIRNQIWDHVIDSDTIAEIKSTSSPTSTRLQHFCLTFPWAGITGANRQCNTEVSDKLAGRRKLVRVGGSSLWIVTRSLCRNALCQRWVKSLVLINFSGCLGGSSLDDDDYQDEEADLERSKSFVRGLLLCNQLENCTHEAWVLKEIGDIRTEEGGNRRKIKVVHHEITLP